MFWVFPYYFPLISNPINKKKAGKQATKRYGINAKIIHDPSKVGKKGQNPKQPLADSPFGVFIHNKSHFEGDNRTIPGEREGKGQRGENAITAKRRPRFGMLR